MPLFKSQRTFSIILLLVFCLISVFAQEAYAQSVGFSLSKAVFDIEAPAGSFHEDSLVIINDADSLVTPVHIELSMWNLKEDSDDVEFVLAEPALNATQWFSIEDGQDILLESGEERRINFSIQIPQNTPPGSYFVSMRFQSVLPEFYFNEEGPRFYPEIATLFFIRVPLFSIDGEETLYSAEIESLMPEGDSIPFVERILPRANAGVFDSAVRELLASVKNDGIYHFKMSGNIVVKNIFGRTLIDEPLPSRILMPDRTRSIEISVLPPPDLDGFGWFKKLLHTTYYSLRTNTYFGPYRAIATLVIPESDLPVVKTANFWVIPWQFWLIIALAIGLIFLMIKRLRGNLFSRIKLSLKILTNRR